MKKYRFFVRRPDGAFGTHQTLPLADEKEARIHAETLCATFGGCDVWDDSGRISLLLQPAPAPQRSGVR